MSEILAISPHVRNNADLIKDARNLGYINGSVLDATFGLGRFWNGDYPRPFFANDLYSRTGAFAYDYTALAVNGGFPESWNEAFGTVVLDPPYKLNGTSTGKGPSTADVGYGVGGEYQTVAAKMHGIYKGMGHCTRVLAPGGHLLVKCQDQVVSGKVFWQTHKIAEHAAVLKLSLVDQLHLVGHRAQPKGRRQVHARRNYSTLMIFLKGK